MKVKEILIGAMIAIVIIGIGEKINYNTLKLLIPAIVIVAVLQYALGKRKV